MTTLFDDVRVPDRIWEKIHVDRDSLCWVWTASLRPSGYAQVHFKKRTRIVHHLVYELTQPEYEEGLDLDHLCRLRCCVNPSHLEPVTRGENLGRGEGLIWMERAKITHCPQGHPYSGDNLGHDGKGRRCRTCDARRKREYKQRKKEERG